MRALLILLSPLILAAGDPDLGKLSAMNIATMAGPAPTYAGVPAEGSDGLRGARAVNRYRRGAVKALTLPRASSISSQTSSDGGGDSGGAPAGGPQ